MIGYETIATTTFYVLTGAFTGLMSGIIGIGGGVIIVPALLYLFGHNAIVPDEALMHFAVGSSLAIMIFTSLSSIRSHCKLGDVLWHVYQRMWPGIVVGVILGALLANFIPTYWLKIFFGLFLLAVSWKMVKGINVGQPLEENFPRAWVNRLVSFAIGFKSGLLGVGGGTLIIPYLTYCGVDPRKIAAVSSMCTMTVAVLGTLIFMISSLSVPHLVSWSTGYVYWPAVGWVAIPSMLCAPLGARLSYVLPVKQLGFVVILVVTAISLLR